MKPRILLRIVTAATAVALGGTAMAVTLPSGIVTGVSPESSAALVTLAIPAVVGVNVAHNFVLDFNSGTKCWGTTSSQGTFPQASSGTTTYTFAVSTTPTNSATTNVACPGAGAQPDVATVQVLSTYGSASKLQASIVDGGVGGQATAFTALIPDIFSATRLTLSTADCTKGTPVSPMNLLTTVASLDTAIPATGWNNCTQKLTLTLQAATPVGAGTATGILTFTISNP